MHRITKPLIPGFVAIMLGATLFVTEASAQMRPPPGGVSSDKTRPEDANLIGTQMYAGSIALAFGCIVLGILAYLITHKSIDIGNFSKLSGLSIVLSVGLSLIIMGYTQDQIAPMMGLLGTIAGYLLGKTETDSSNQQRNQGSPPPNPNER